MTGEYRTVLDRVSRVPGVRGAMLVDAQAGVPIVSELAEGVDGRAVAALASSLLKRGSRAAGSAEFGPVRTLQLEAEQGSLLIASAGEVLAVAVARGDAQLGLVRLEIQKAVEGL